MFLILKSNICSVVNGNLETTWCVTLYTVYLKDWTGNMLKQEAKWTIIRYTIKRIPLYGGGRRGPALPFAMPSLLSSATVKETDSNVSSCWFRVAARFLALVIFMCTPLESWGSCGLPRFSMSVGSYTYSRWLQYQSVIVTQMGKGQ